MAEFDGSVNIDTRINTKGFNSGMQQVTASARKATGNIASSITAGLGGAVRTVLRSIRNLALGFVALISAVAVFGSNLIDKLQKSLDTQSAYYQQLQTLRHEFYRVQAAVFSIFSTLLQAALPTIIRLVDWLVRMLEIINQIVAALLGQKTVQRVVASSVADTANSAGKAAKNTERMKKAAQGALAAFDQLDVLARKTDADTDTGAGAGAGGFQFEEVPIDDKWLSFAENIKQAFLDAIQRIKDAWARFVEIWDAFWASPIGQLIQALWKNFLDAWDRILTNARETLQKIKDGIERILTGISQFVTGILTGDWRLAWEGLKNIVGGVWDVIKAMVTGSLTFLLEFFKGWLGAVRLVWEFLLGIWRGIWESIKIIAAGVVLTIRNLWRDFATWFQTNVLTPLQSRFAVALESIRNKFFSIFEGVKSIVRNAFNGIIDALNSLLSRVSSGINSIIRMVNTVGGFTGISLPSVGTPSIPRLATGAVIPANAEFLAVLGDQRSGKNIEAPVELIRQIMDDVVSARVANQTITVNFGGDFAQIVRLMKPMLDRENTRVGNSLISGGLK